MLAAEITGNYEIFTKPQAPANRLRREQWYQLRDIIRWIQPTQASFQQPCFFAKEVKLGSPFSWGSTFEALSLHPNPCFWNKQPTQPYQIAMTLQNSKDTSTKAFQAQLHAVLVLLSIRALGKSKELVNQLPKDKRRGRDFSGCLSHRSFCFLNIVPA